MNGAFNLVKELREMLGITQIQLCEQVKVSRQTLSKLEQNDYDPSLSLAHKISNFFMLPIDSVFYFCSRDLMQPFIPEILKDFQETLKRHELYKGEY